MTSTLKFNRWENAAGQAIADAASGSLSLGRNLLYNGAMQVAQRGTSATGLGNGDGGYHTADRWQLAEGGTSTAEFTQTVENDGPTNSGFSKSLKMECTTSKASTAADEIFLIRQRLEGQDLQGLKKGSSAAESLTLSFWVKSNTTGTYVTELFDQDNNRTVSKAYSVDAADTWEKKIVTFPGDTTGAFDNDSNLSLDFQFYLLAGDAYSSGIFATNWENRVNANRGVGQTNLAASTGNYWQVTGVQLETGTVASGFDHKSYGVELTECQRYFIKIAPEGNFGPFGMGQAYNGTDATFAIHLPTTMRSTPSISFSATNTFGPTNGGDIYVPATGYSVNVLATNCVRVRAFTAGGLTAGQASGLIRNSSQDAFILMSAEL